jgi:hypothetical protein
LQLFQFGRNGPFFISHSHDPIVSRPPAQVEPSGAGENSAMIGEGDRLDRRAVRPAPPFPSLLNKPEGSRENHADRRIGGNVAGGPLGGWVSVTQPISEETAAADLLRTGIAEQNIAGTRNTS